MRKRITQVRPRNLEHWHHVIDTTRPFLSFGTRLHGSIIALSHGIPTAFISGDLRASGLADLIPLPFFASLAEFSRESLEIKIAEYNSKLSEIEKLVDNQRDFLQSWLMK